MVGWVGAESNGNKTNSASIEVEIKLRLSSAKKLAITIFSNGLTKFFFLRGSLLLLGYWGFAAFLPALTCSYPLLPALNLFDPILSHKMFLDTKSLLE